MVARLPPEKLTDYASRVASFTQSGKSSITVKELRSLTGKLQFATCVIPAGRPFLRRLYDRVAPNDKPFWHVKLSEGHRKDLEMWATFLSEYNGVTIIRQPSVCNSNAISFYTDASDQGYGGTYGSTSVQGHWPARWMKLNIAVREIYPILLVIKMFGHKLKHSRVLFYCDNQVVVAAINNQTSRNKHVMILLRQLILELLLKDITFKALYIPTYDILADAISRFQTPRELLTRYKMKPAKTETPHSLRPTSFIP